MWTLEPGNILSSSEGDRPTFRNAIFPYFSFDLHAQLWPKLVFWEQWPIDVINLVIHAWMSSRSKTHVRTWLLWNNSYITYHVPRQENKKSTIQSNLKIVRSNLSANNYRTDQEFSRLTHVTIHFPI